MTNSFISRLCLTLLFLSGFTTTKKQVEVYSTQHNKLLEISIADNDTLLFMINPVDYDGHNWEYWGFSYDWLQVELKNKLNTFYRKKKISFITDAEPGSMENKPRGVIDIGIRNINFGNPKTNRYSARKSRRVITGYTNTTPINPIYGNVSATIYYENRSAKNTATVVCRIYDIYRGKNILNVQFNEIYYWFNKTATYSGDERVISGEDLKAISNGSWDVPPENELIQHLMNSCNNTLTEKIKEKIKYKLLK